MILFAVRSYSTQSAMQSVSNSSNSRMKYKCRESYGVCKGNCRDKNKYDFRNILSIGVQNHLYNKCD